MHRSSFVLFSILAIAMVAAPALAQQLEQTLFLDTTVNNVFKGRFTAIWRGKDVLVKPEDLKKMGLLFDSGQRIVTTGSTYISLASLQPNLKYRLNKNNFSLTIDAETSLLADLTSQILNGSNKPTDLTYSRNSSAFINYSFSANNFHQSLDNYNISTEIGYIFNTSLLQSGFKYSSDHGWQRGFSSLIVDDPASLSRLIVGDTLITNLSSLGGTPTIGGISFGRRFSLDPYLASPYQDYSSANILKPGLTDYNISLGLRRQEDGNSINYNDLVALGSYIWGVSDSLAAGVRLEGANNLINFGGDVALHLPFGELGIEVAASSGQGYSGGAGALRYSYNSPGFGLSIGSRLFTDNFANTSLEPTQDRATLDNNVQVSFPIASTSLSLQYQNTQFRDQSSTNRLSALTSFAITPQTNLSLSFSIANQANGQNENTIFAEFSYYPGDDTNASLSYQNQNGRITVIAQVDKSPGTSDGIGYRVQTQLAEQQLLSTDVTLFAQTAFGRYDLNYNQSGGQSNTYFTAAGGIAFIDGTVAFTRPLDSSFALGEVPSIPNVTDTQISVPQLKWWQKSWPTNLLQGLTCSEPVVDSEF